MFGWLLKHAFQADGPMPAVPPGAPPVPALDETTLDRWLSTLRPSAEEWAWRAIPWRPSLWHAVLDARREVRPIALFTMNGHPLGST